MTNKEKILKLVEDHDETVLKAIAERRANRAWLKKSQAIALKILQTLKAKGSKQKELAEAVGVSAQQVNKWVKGNENFTLETLTKLEAALGISLIEVSQESYTTKKQVAHIQLETKRNSPKRESNYTFRPRRKRESKVIALNEPSVYYPNKDYAYQP